MRAGDVWSTTIPNGRTEDKGVGARVDLSRGRIDLYSTTPSNPPPLGPVPESGSPGDGDPWRAGEIAPLAAPRPVPTA